MAWSINDGNDDDDDDYVLCSLPSPFKARSSSKSRPPPPPPSAAAEHEVNAEMVYSPTFARCQADTASESHTELKYVHSLLPALSGKLPSLKAYQLN